MLGFFFLFFWHWSVTPKPATGVQLSCCNQDKMSDRHSQTFQQPERLLSEVATNGGGQKADKTIRDGAVYHSACLCGGAGV